jgi:uncharacterized membrane protein YvbJ
MYCINCGNQIPENGRFCAYCGAASTEIAEKVDSAEASARTNTKTLYAKIEQENLPKPQLDLVGDFNVAACSVPKKPSYLGKAIFIICLLAVFGLSVFCGVLLNMVTLW